MPSNLPESILGICLVMATIIWTAYLTNAGKKSKANSPPAATPDWPAIVAKNSEVIQNNTNTTQGVLTALTVLTERVGVAEKAASKAADNTATLLGRIGGTGS